MLLDDHGQLVNKRVHAARLMDRKTDQLLGLCEGVLADGAVAQAEAEFLYGWIQKNPEVVGRWPANILFARLEEFLADGVLDGDEEGELLDLLTDMAGIQLEDSKTSASLPLCYPVPDVRFEGCRFVLTGRFASGTRKECEQQVVSLGGVTAKNVTGLVDYVVIGSLVSEQWIHESYGRKIEKAVDLREEGKGISIISEEYWAKLISGST